MASHLIKTLKPILPATFLRRKTTSSEYVSCRARDPNFEKLMDKYKNLLKVTSIQDLILSNPASPPSLSLLFLDRLSQHLRLNRGAAPFLRRYPHIFHLFSVGSQPHCRLTPAAANLAALESDVSSPVEARDRLLRLLSVSLSRTLPLRAVLKVHRELALPDDFEDSVISLNPKMFQLVENPQEPNTHLIKLVAENPSFRLTSSVQNWRMIECCKDECNVDRTDIMYSFKHGFPPGMKLSKNFKAKVKEWQRLPYVGPYEDEKEVGKSKLGKMRCEKRAVAIVHEFLSLTVEKMVEVEKISHFRKWFGIDLNIRDLFLDHPGIFYLSTKGKRHTVFLREAYERGCLIEKNPVYEARRKLLDLVMLERRGVLNGDLKLTINGEKEEKSEEDDSD